MGAICIEEREAEPYDELEVLDSVINEAPATLYEHLNHLKESNEIELYKQAIGYLSLKGINMLKVNKNHVAKSDSTNINKTKMGDNQECSSRNVLERNDNKKTIQLTDISNRNISKLNQWPVQLHLVPPNAPYFKDRELVIMNTCGPVASANVHEDYLRGRAVVIACPKLDYTEPYRDKLYQIFEMSNIKKAIVVIMEVPCCKGLSKIACDAAAQSDKDIEIIEHILTLDGYLKQEIIISGKNVDKLIY